MFDDLFLDYSLEDSSSTFDDSLFSNDDYCSDINPGSGLPMMGCSIDVAGYVYGDGPDYSDLF